MNSRGVRRFTSVLLFVISPLGRADVPPAHPAPGLFTAALCARTLATVSSGIVRPRDEVADRLKSWDSTDAANASLVADFDHPAVTTRVNVLTGRRLTKFVRRLEASVLALDRILWERRAEVARDRATPRLLLGPAALIAGLDLTLVYRATDHWAYAAAAAAALLVGIVEGRRLLFHATYLDQRPTAEDRAARANLREFSKRVNGPVAAGAAHPSTLRAEAWIDQDLVEDLHDRGARTYLYSYPAVKRLNESIEFARRWRWLGPLVPGRRKVSAIYHFDRDAAGAPVLTIVSRVKRR